MGEVLPLAIGIAASPFPVIPVILLLFTDRARAAAWSFLSGWLVGVGGTAAVFVLLAEVVDQSSDTPEWASWLRIVGGVALVAYGVKQWVGRGHHSEQPAWMRQISGASPRAAFRLALLLSAANPKVLLLAAAAGLAIGADDFTARGDVVAVVLFTLVASVSVAIPVLAYTLLGERVLRPLGVARDWLVRNNAAVMAVVLVVIGLLLLQEGITSL
ncbi:GAP family protein [Longivirga aurantiaca]|uniref:GAP family protein n=1 Tax=Longivirga aurantiaca TaxID=1837743 RepID=A0ABW1SVK1_9ACTN